VGDWGAEPCIWNIWSFNSVILVITLVLVCSLAFMEIHYVFWGLGLLIFAHVVCLRCTYISCSNTLSWFQNICPVWSFCYHWHELLLTFAGRIIALFIVTFFLFFLIFSLLFIMDFIRNTIYAFIRKRLFLDILIRVHILSSTYARPSSAF
jgi:hypothetical protein